MSDGDLLAQVRDRYARAALAVTDVSARAGQAGAAGRPTAAAETCWSPGNSSGRALYDPDDAGAAPDEALLASLGCGNPTAVVDLAAGERCSTLPGVAGSTCRSARGGSVRLASRTAST